jgi:hypothetical protein
MSAPARVALRRSSLIDGDPSAARPISAFINQSRLSRDHSRARSRLQRAVADRLAG